MKKAINRKEVSFLLYQTVKENFKNAIKRKGMILFLTLLCWLMYGVFAFLEKKTLNHASIGMNSMFFGMVLYPMIGIPAFAMELFPNHLSKIFYYLPMTKEDRLHYFHTYMKNKIGVTLGIELFIFTIMQIMLQLPVKFWIFFFLLWVQITINEHMGVSIYIQPKWYEILQTKDDRWKTYYKMAYVLFGGTYIEMFVIVFALMAQKQSMIGIFEMILYLLFVVNTMITILFIKQYYPLVLELSTNYEATQLLDHTKRKR